MVLITGGTGVMGSVLVRKMRERGIGVRVFTLPNDPGASRVEQMGAEICYGNIAHREDVEKICQGIDTVYHLAAIIIAPEESQYHAINIEGTRNIINESLRARVKHFVHVSSASVVYPKPTPYSLSKRAAEKIVKLSGLHWTIIRPTLVYDAGRGGIEFDMFLSYLRKFPIIPFIGKGTALKRPVYVNDIIQGLLSVYHKKNTLGKIYNCSGGQAISMIEFTRLCLRLMGTPNKRIITIPTVLCLFIAWIMKKTMKNPPLRWPVIAGVTQDANLDPEQARRDLGYNPVDVYDKLPACFPRL